MVLVNLTDVFRNFYFDGTIVDIPPKGESVDIILTEENIRAIILASKPADVKFKITAQGVDDVALARLGADPAFIYRGELDKEKESSNEDGEKSKTNKKKN
jgi:hypothetical protein